MSDLPAGVDARGIHCYPSPDNSLSYYCVPADPTPELDPSGQPTIALWLIPSQPRLQLGAVWALSEVDLQIAREAILQGKPEADPAALRLAAAPVSVERVNLLMGDGSESFNEVATSRSSGFPPYQAVFSLTLNPEQVAWTSSALNGGRGHLVVEYVATLACDIPTGVLLQGDVSEDVAALQPGATADDAAAQVHRAIAANRLTITRTPAAGIPEDAWQPLELRVRSLAASELLGLSTLVSQNSTASALSDQGSGPPAVPPQVARAHLHEEASATYSASMGLTRRADISAWFSDGSGSQHIRGFSSPSA